jgi:hypothetical protein
LYTEFRGQPTKYRKNPVGDYFFNPTIFCSFDKTENMNSKHEEGHIYEIARRLFIALDSQTTALSAQYGHNLDAWPQHLKDARSTLEFAVACDCCKWKFIPENKQAS